MFKGTKFYSIFSNKCPKCQKGDFFINKNPYKAGFIKMHDSCPHCGELFNKEVGFYYGAMYVSYALGVALFVTIWASCNWFFDNVSVWTQIGLVIFFSIILGPYLFALSKIIWANFFIHFDKNYAKQRG